MIGRSGSERPKGGNEETSFRAQEKKARSSTLKDVFGGVGASASTLLGTVLGAKWGNPTGGAAAGAVLGVTVGQVFKHVGTAIAGQMDARREAKAAGGGGGAPAVAAGGAATIGAVKSIVFAASQAAKDGGARIAGMKSQIEEILAHLNGALDGTSSGEIREALGYLGGGRRRARRCVEERRRRRQHCYAVGGCALRVPSLMDWTNPAHSSRDVRKDGPVRSLVSRMATPSGKGPTSTQFPPPLVE